MFVKNLFLLLRKKSVRLLMVLLVGGSAFLFYKTGKAILFPGPLSSIKHTTSDVGGYSTHASFEQECGHCHAPVHCITDSHCQDCHMDVAEQRATNTGLHSMLPGTQKCQSCHPEHRGRDVGMTEFAFANVDHEALAGFSLAKHQMDYQDKTMNCESCHDQGRFASETMDCVSCHAQEDHDYMAAHIEEYGTECVPCHNGSDRMMAFDHDTVYPLVGGHADLACADCHADKQFSESPRDCLSCHEDPEVHAGVFGEDCVRCHTATAWSPAMLTGHTFFLNHGSEQNLACETCHTETYTDYTCYGCHDHQPTEMAAAHVKEGYTQFGDCESCHPTGVSGEGAAYKERNEQNSSAGEGSESAGTSGVSSQGSIDSGEKQQGKEQGAEPTGQPSERKAADSGHPWRPGTGGGR